MALTQKEHEWLDTKFDGIHDRFTEVLVEIAKLKIKSGVWGLVGGLIPVVIMIAIYFFIKG
jgi:hypothetical protein